MPFRTPLVAGPLAVALLAVAAPGAVTAQTLLNVSYDPTRELYREVNEAFAEHWESQGNEAPEIEASHGGSGSQARAVIDGLEADVVTLALASDIDRIAEAGLLPADWQAACPTTLRPTPRPSCSWSARGTLKGSRTGATSQPRASRSSRPTPRPRAAPAGTTSPRGPGPSATARIPKRSWRDSTATCRARLGRARLHHDLRPARHRRRAAGLGERGLLALRSWARTSSTSWCPPSRCWPSRR
jgi:hypothetical protein